jgi:16S rRNA (uracil1498-N3)-methyltransferase
MSAIHSMTPQKSSPQKSSPRLYVSDDLIADQSITLSTDQSHYLIRVMRRHAGDAVILFNGRDGEWRGIITDAHKSTCRLMLDGQLREQLSEPDIWLAFAPIKKARMDFLIEKSVELGVAQLLPVMTQNTDVNRLNRDRLQATAIEAAEQCERLSIPKIHEPYAFDAFLDNWPRDRRLLYLDETGHGATINEVLSSASEDGFLVGPEGGFSAEELAQLQSLDFAHAINLGPRILRAETAALAALSLWQSIWGDTCNSRLR